MASYGNRFVFEFVSQNGDDVEIFISKKNYYGTPAYRPVGKPPILRRERNGCILGTSLEIYAECKIDKEYAELYTSSADDYLVEFYKNRVLQWRGYVSPELYSEPDIAPPYDVQIIATDGLGELKNTVFDRPDEAYSLKNHLDYILEKTGLSLDLDLISSLSWDDEVAGNDPLTLLDINVNLTHLASESDYDVLQDILTSFNAHITQQDGKWMILRKTDLYDNLPRFRQAEFGSVNKTTWWPIGILSTDIIPAKRKLTLTHENNYKDSILPSLIAGVSGGWELSSGVYYNTEEEAYILPDEAGIAYTIELPVYPLAVPLEFSINARPLFEEELREDRAVLMYYFELNGTVDGVEGTYYLYNAFDDTLGRARWQWLPPQLPGQPMYNMKTWWRSGYPEDVELEVTTINGILPLGDNVVPQSIRLVVQNLPLLSSYRIAIYDIILAQADQIRGLQLIAEVGNAARESTEVSVVMSSSDDPMLDKTLYGVLHLDGGITQWRTPYNTATDLLRFLALDYAMLNALPSVRYRGTLNYPKLLTPWIPIIFTRDDTYYFVETYEYDLLNDELGVELISIPNAKVTIESETIIEIPEGSSGNSTSSSSGGGTGGVNGGTIIIDASMSEESENAVQNKVIKAYVDGKAAEAQAAAEQYILNEVLTDYATTKYVDEREDYLVGYAEGLVNTLENDINGRGYLTSAALGDYATKNDIKDFVTKGNTLEHYGITDAVINGNYLTPDSPVPTLGFATTANGWPYSGAAIMVGGKGEGQLRLISTLGNGYRPEIFVSGRYLDNESEWARIITDKNIGSNAIAIDSNGRTLLPTDTNAKTSYVYGGNGWKVTGPAMIFPHGGYSGLFNFAMHNTTVNPDGFDLYINVNYGGTLGNWAKVLTDKDAGTMQARGRYADGDANDFLSAGSYEVWGGGAISNVPSGYGTILISRGSASNMYFTSQLLTDAQGHLYSRMSEGYSANWKDWRTIIDDSNISQYAISQSSGDARYLKLSGGTLTGMLTANVGIKSNFLYNTNGYAIIEAAEDTYINAQCAIYENRKLFLYYANELQVVNKGWAVKFTIQDNLATFNIPLKSGAITSSGAVTATGFVLGGVNVDSWTNFVGKNAYLMPTNGFDSLGMMQVNFLSNALYAAGQRYDAAYDGLASFDLNALTDGNYENGYTACRVPANSTGSFTIYHSDGRSLIDGYPYGNIILSFYYTNIPSSITVEVYCNYASQGVGWKTLTRSEVRGSQNGVYAYYNPYYNITQLRVTMSAGSEEVHLSEIDFQLERGKLENLPAVTKFAVPQTLYGNITFAGGITLGNKTITSWDEIKASGNYLPLTGGTVNGAVIINGTLRVQSTYGHNIRFDGYALQVGAGLYVSSGYSLRLGGESITSWGGLKNILGLKSLAYKDSIAFSEITSKPTTLSGYGITDAYTRAQVDALIANVEGGSGSGTGNITIDSALSEISVNPVQNNVITANINSINASLTSVNTTLGSLKSLAYKDKVDWGTDIENIPDDLGGEIKVVSQTATSGTVGINPNVLNQWSTALTVDANIVINFSESNTEHYMLEFTTGATVPTISLPSGVVWQDGYDITQALTVNRTYQISILNNLAVGGVFK